MMKKRLSLLITFTVLCTILSSAAAAVKGGYKQFTPGMATVSPFKKAPTIDGKIEPGEWDGAIATSGFLGIQGIGGDSAANLKGYKGKTYCGFTKERLYMAVVSELPIDGKLLTKQTNRDSKTIFDDGIEIWIDPNRDLRKPGVDQSKLGHIQCIANSNGAIYDLEFKGIPNSGWNGNWDMANSIDKKNMVWITEFSLPFADLGLDKEKIFGRSIGILLARNFKRPWRQLTWFPHRNAFVNYLEYPRIFLTKDDPSVQVETLGKDYREGQLDTKLKIYNPGPARKVKVTTHIDSTDRPEVDEEQIIDLPANGTAVYAYKPPELRLQTTTIHKVTFTVASTDAKQTYFSYNFVYRKMPANWAIRLNQGPDYANGVKFAYYPSFNFLRVKVNTAVLEKEAETIKSAKLAVTDQAGKAIVSGEMTWEKLAGQKEFTLPNLPNGSYTLTVTLDNYKHIFTRTFKRIHFPWEGNKLGITSKIYPPFKPIKFDEKSNVLSVVLRDYTVGDLGFWDSVTAAGEEILAAPIALKINGTPIKGKGSFEKKGHRILEKWTYKKNKKGKRIMLPVYRKETRVPDQMATYNGKAVTPAVTVETKCETEYDGCMKVTLKLLPGSDKTKKLENLTFEIPLKDECAPLHHVSTTSLRVNPAGATPKGTGKVWDSNDFPDGDWNTNFKCYMWLGGQLRGICWFADNDKDWELKYDKKQNIYAPCQELIRKDGVLTIKINLVQQPVLIDKPREIVFGVMATPAKPMMKDWRSIDSMFMMSYYNDATFSGKAPRNEDLTILDKMQELRLGGTMGRYMEYWIPKNLSTVENEKARKGILGLIGVMVNAFSRRAQYYSLYMEEFHSTSAAHEAARVFQCEWSGRDYVSYPETGYRRHVGGNVHTGNITDSYVDFACWSFAEQIRRGIGIYFDNAFPMQGFDLKTTTAYVMPNGKIQASAGIWARRRYLKRVWILHQQLAPAETKPLMMIHMTNTHIIPYLVWNQSNLDLEWMFGDHSAQSRYPIDLLQTETTGLQSGNIPFVLAQTKNRFHTHFIHEARFFSHPEQDMRYARLFGYGQDDCEVFNYWKKDYPVKTSDDKVKSILLKKDGKLLLVFASWNPTAEKVTFNVDLKTLGCNPAKAINVYTEDDLNQKDGTFTMDVDSYGVGMVQFE